MNKIAGTAILVGSLSLLGGACFKAVETNTNTNGNTNAIELNSNASVNTNSNSNINAEINTNTSIIDTSDWVTYSNEDYGFSITNPKEWVLYEESSSAPSEVVGGENSKSYTWLISNNPVIAIYPEGDFDTSIPVEGQREYEFSGKKIFEYYSDTVRILFVGAPANTDSSTFRIELYLGQADNPTFSEVLDSLVIE